MSAINKTSSVLFASNDAQESLDSVERKIRNFTVYVTETAGSTDPEYEQFLADVWVGIVLTLMVLSCVCCMCSCLLYHKFQQWKRGVLDARNAAAAMENGGPDGSESLPSYTIVSGLPTYDEALEQLKKVHEMTAVHKRMEGAAVSASDTTWIPRTPPTVAKLSVADLLQIYKANESLLEKNFPKT